MDQTTPDIAPAHALHQAELIACGRYLEARKAMVTLAGCVASLKRLVSEQPQRANYRIAWNRAQAAHATATERTELAYLRWQAAQMRTDDLWTATHGRCQHAVVTGQAA